MTRSPQQPLPGDTPGIDEVFAAALREALVKHVGDPASARRRRRWRIVVPTLFIVAGAGIGGIAVATHITRSPGSEVNDAVAAPLTVVRVNASSIQLGNPPKNATVIQVELTCLSPGRFTMIGSVTTCDAHDVARGVSFVPCGVNARGQTYGTVSSLGYPDLEEATAGNGRQGYIVSTPPGSEAAPTSPAHAGAMQRERDRPVPVYESDGVTVIGELHRFPQLLATEP